MDLLYKLKKNVMYDPYLGSGRLVLLFLLFTQVSFAQSPNVRGTVLDQENLALPGANIHIVGTTRGAHTGVEGDFALYNDKFPITLRVSMVGFLSKEIVLQGPHQTLRISLESDNVLNELVVIGYGESSRVKLTSSVSKLQGATIVQQPISNPILGLQGRAPGLYMTTASGNIGSNVTVAIRGNNTILSSGNPLYIIDGVPMPSTGINAATIGGAAGVQSPFINLNSADIESVEVLKDADATSIYGTRGANGVILISTKKGKAGPLRFNADVYTGYQQAVNKLDLLNTQEYIAMRRKAFANDGITNLTSSNAFDIVDWGENRYTDFQDLLFGKTESVTDIQTNLQGGSENTNFIFAIGYRDENGVVMGENNQKKGVVRLNLNHRSADKKFTLGTTLTYTLMNTKSIGTSGFTYAWLAPNLPTVDEATGLPYFHPGNATNTQSPLKQLASSSDLKNFQFIGSTSVGYQLTNELQAKVDASFTRLDYNGIEKYRNGYFSPYEAIDYTNSATFGTNYQYTYNIEPQLNYKKKVGDGRLTGLLGTTFQETLGGGQLITADNFSSELLMDNLASASRIAAYSNTYNQYKFQSVFGRVTYDFKNKYIINGTYRRDGSSRFAPDKRFGNFWAIGGAWIASNEDFIRNNFSKISLLKLRSSYGLTGNDAISNYMYMETFGATPYPYNNAAGLYANRLGNSQFGWETNYKFEIALELNLFNNRFTSTTAFFNNQGSNQLVNYPVASQSGWTSYVANLNGALIRNRGVEFEFTSHNIKTNAFNWRSNFNITSYKNTLVRFPNLSSSAYSNTYEIGKSINVFRRYEFDKINPENGTPLVVDQNGDGVFTAVGDYISYGSSDPKFYGGFGNNFSYKGLELDIFFQFVKKPYTNGYINSSTASQPGIIYNVPKFLLEGTWQNPGDEATRPRLSTVNSGDFFQAYNRYRLSTASVVDGSFGRLKNLSLAYSLPQKVLKALHVKNLRVYVLGQNLWTITKYEGFDPETAGTVTPPMRIYTVGLNLGL